MIMLNIYLLGSVFLKEFHRQGDSNTTDQHKLPVPVFARYFRFNPTDRHGWNCLRVELYSTESELSS